MNRYKLAFALKEQVREQYGYSINAYRAIGYDTYTVEIHTEDGYEMLDGFPNELKAIFAAVRHIRHNATNECEVSNT
jgi:hypothetical protein